MPSRRTLLGAIRGCSGGAMIAGGGLAAQRPSDTLRRLGYADPIRMVCAEPHLPHDRPPLSKEVLSGELSDESVRSGPGAWYEHNAVDALMNVSTTDLSTQERRVGLPDGTTLRCERLLIASRAWSVADCPLRGSSP